MQQVQNLLNSFMPQQNDTKKTQKENNDIETWIDIGQQGIKLLQKKNYPQAKIMLMTSVDQLCKYCKQNDFKQLPQQKQIDIKSATNNLLKYAELCHSNILSMEDKDDPYVKIIKENIVDKSPEIYFKDIAGLQDVKDQLHECIIMPSIRPDLFQGIRAPPKGILFYGPPGNGKTMIAKGVATECNAKFFNISASTLVTKYVGDSEKLMRTLFTLAQLHQPSIIYIDEIDSMLTSRSSGEHEASRRLKTEFLVQMDGVTSSEDDRVMVIGATNRPEELDSAALRRFTKRILINMPDKTTRIDLIKKHLTKITHDISKVQINKLAEKLNGYSCSDITALMKESALQPMRQMDKQVLLTMKKDFIRPVTQDDIVASMDIITPSLKMSEIQQFIDWSKNVKK